MTSKPPDRALVAAIATGWIEAEAPAQSHDLLFRALDTWLADPSQPATQLWATIQALFRRSWLLDVEVSALRCALGLMPDAGAFRLALAEALYYSGLDQEAEAHWRQLGQGGGAWHMLGLDLAAGDAALFEQRAKAAQAWARTTPDWSDHHSALIKRLVPAGLVDEARTLLDHFGNRDGFSIDRLLGTAWLYMHVGEPARARALLQPLWQHDNPAHELVVGRFSGTITPYSPEIEAQWLARIDAALPDAAPAAALPDAPAVAAGTKVVVVGFERSGRLPNDLAHHFVNSGRAAGLDMRAYLDTAIAMTHEFRGTDEEAETRIQAFEAEMERFRPHVVLVDWVGAGDPQRGLTPARLGELARRLDFRVVVSVRDAVGPAEQRLKPWLSVANAITLFHPLAGMRGNDPRYLPIPVPTLYPRPPRAGRADLNLVFVGAVNFPLRYALLSVLQTEDVPFTAISGHERDRLVPDMDAYWRMLERSRAALNISAHTKDEHLITGRVWESTAAGTLLVEQDNPATRQYLTPYCHYLPWRDVNDIIHIAHLIQRHPDIAERIALQAQAWVNLHFGPRRFWAAVLGHAERFSPTSM